MRWLCREGVVRGDRGRQEFAAFTKDTCTFQVDLRKKTKGKSKMKTKRKEKFFLFSLYTKMFLSVENNELQLLKCVRNGLN